jgi:hypothetical protein
MIIRGRVLESGRFNAVVQRRQAVSAGRTIAHDDREFMRFLPIQLFNRQNRYNTFVGLLFGLGSLMAIWTTVSWLPTILQQLAEKTGMTNPGEVKNHGIMLWSVGGIFGYAAFGFIADWIGRRWTVALYSIGSTTFGLILYLGLSLMTRGTRLSYRSSGFLCSACSLATRFTSPNCSRRRSAPPAWRSAMARRGLSPALAH